jgi:ABC-type antimicrobial peptide transport system permease subunit
VRRTLTYYWRLNLAVLLAAAVATTVLGGALLVGDSVRASLRDLILDRLGRIDYALVADRYADAGLAERIAADSDLELVAPAIVARGSAVHGATEARASQVDIYGIEPEWNELFDGAAFDFERGSGQLFPSVIINHSLSRELDAEVGDPVLLNFGRFSEVPRDTLMGETDPADVIGTLRLSVARVIPDEGPGRFGLSPNQHQPMLAFVALERLQRALDRRGRINALFVASGSPSADPDRRLVEVATLDDLGIRLTTADDYLLLESDEFVLRPQVVDAIGDAVGELSAPALGVQSYVINRMRAGDRLLPYSTVAAIDRADGPEDWATLIRTDGSPAALPGPNGILLNTWAAEDLQVGAGDEIEVEYYVVGPREQLRVERRPFVVEGVVALRAMALDRSLTPDYPGIDGAADISDWEPPFPVDLTLIREEDEAYWDRYEATPKAFVSAATGEALWSTRFGSLTSFRVGAAPGATLDETAGRLRDELIERLPPASLGMAFRPVRQLGLEAASGATDFGGLFIGFSLFLIVSAAMLVGLLFGLGVEQRARQIGLLRAVGYPLRKIRRSLLAEGSLLAALGGLLGTLGGVAYAWLMMAGLRSLWLPAVGSSQLFLHVTPSSLLLGWVIAVVVVLFSIALTLRRLKKVAPPRLLAGSLRLPTKVRRARLSIRLAWGSTALALALVAYAWAAGAQASPGLAFGTGALLLVAGLAFFAAWCRGAGRSGAGLGHSMPLIGMAARNSSWNAGRSILSVALVASACFVIVTVAANRRELGTELESKQSGSGGFALVAESNVPLFQNLNLREGRLDLGFDRVESDELDAAVFYPFRLLPGDDASCLNLYRPEKPRILGAPPELLDRGGFVFQQTIDLPEGATAPWSLLDLQLEPGVIPAIADYNSAMWIMHLGLGKDLEVEDEFGETIRLRLVGLLQTSILQSEVLISEEKFLEHFPSQAGYSYFLIDAPPAARPAVARLLESKLGAFGFDTTTARDKLAGYQVVEHTYLSTFQMLGGLGLLLGTVGLGLVLVRNLIERKGELATMRAFGFRRARLAWLVLAENAFLLVVGLLTGTIAAIVSVAPRLTSIHVPWASLGVTLGVILVVGLLASVVAVAGALRVPLLPALKAER